MRSFGAQSSPASSGRATRRPGRCQTGIRTRPCDVHTAIRSGIRHPEGTPRRRRNRRLRVDNQRDGRTNEAQTQKRISALMGGPGPSVRQRPSTGWSFLLGKGGDRSVPNDLSQSRADYGRVITTELCVPGGHETRDVLRIRRSVPKRWPCRSHVLPVRVGGHQMPM